MNNDSQNHDDSLPFFDGGDTGCGELLLDLLLFIKKQPDESVVRRCPSPAMPLKM